MNGNERNELQNILVEYIENPRKMGSCILSIEDLCRRVHSRWNGFRYASRDIDTVETVLLETAEKHNMSVQDMKGSRKSKRYSDARRDGMTKLYEAGFNYAEIARAFDRHPSTVIYILTKNNE